ncbi:hypothetical protein IGI65_001070 [Enterococcus sp. DIV0755b]|uniref:glycosyltransferase n=1 Tax=Enterococcus sp. DIV0755b TaxID=2774657 RepID=UPI003F1EED6A
MKSKIGIVILTYNNGNLTNDCLKSIVLSKCDDFEYLFYLIDNSEESQLHLIIDSLEEFIDYKYFYVKNRGYSAGNNVGCFEAQKDFCEYIIVTNNDVIFNENTIKGLVNEFGNNSNVGIIGPTVFLPNGQLQEISMKSDVTLKSTYLSMLRNTPLKFLARKTIEKFFYTNRERPELSFYVYAVSGCCFMMNRECYEKILPFDENVFLYHEEFILGMKMKEIGYKTLYSSKADIIHIGGASTGIGSTTAFNYFMESELYFYKRYTNSSNLALLLLVIIRFTQYVKMSLKNGEKVDLKRLYSLLFRLMKNTEEKYES